MTPERWRRVEEIFLAALEHDPAERAQFLTAQCGEDHELLAAVETMLRDEPHAEGHLERAVIEAAEAVHDEAPAVTRRIGPYEILRELGRGGMGTVYLARRADEQFQQEVALKLMRLGMDTEYTRSRFLRERQLLANLNHPNIARLLDGGTTDDGLPYFALEYVAGLPITTYCREHQLDIRSRLILFRRVCAAVQYAHQNLVIHRDLKPGNILVTSDGIPKLLDFGIAKLIDEGSAEPAQPTTVLMLTPDYASPEQVRGQPVTTATDIYSLGVLLYELLTGVRAHRFASHTPQEFERTICEVEPVKPSTHQPRIAGDLDNIVLMALRKEPDRRYATAEQFADDVRRYLDGLPITARQATIRYRASKFVGRHRLAVAAAVLVLISLAGGVLGVSWQARRAARQAEIAERRFQQVRTLANTFLFEVDGSIRSLPGSTEARELIIRTALTYLDGLVSESEDEPLLRLELARAYERIGDVQGNPSQPNLGQLSAARESYRKGIGILESMAATDGSNAELLWPLASMLDKLGSLEQQAGSPKEALRSFERSLALLDRLASLKDGSGDSRRMLAETYVRNGLMRFRSGDAKSAVPFLEKAVAITEERLSAEPSEEARSAASNAHRRLGQVMNALGDLSGAHSHLARTLALREPALTAERPNASQLRGLAQALNVLGDLLGNPLDLNLGETAKALECYRRALDILQKLNASDPSNAQPARDLAYTHFNIAAVSLETNPAFAAESSRKGLTIAERLSRNEPRNLDLRRDLAWGNVLLGAALSRRGKTKEALGHMRQAESIQQTLFDAEQSRMVVRNELTLTRQWLGDVQLAARDPAAALASYRKALDMAAAAAAQQPSNLRFRASLADCYQRMGAYYSSVNDPQQSRSWHQKSFDIWNDWTKDAAASPYQARKRDLASRALTGILSKSNGIATER